MTASEPVVGILLAGGRSSRMGGGDKCLLPLAGRPILAHVIERLKPQVAELIISANGDPARFSAFGLPVVEDRLGGYIGPLAGVLAGLEWTRTNRPECRFAITAASDTPFLPISSTGFTGRAARVSRTSPWPGRQTGCTQCSVCGP